jgi:nucleoside phosphorylase
MDASQYTIGMICALPYEYTAALSMLDEEHRQPNSDHIFAGDVNTYTLGVMGDHKIVITAFHRGEYGTTSAATVAANMCRSFPNIRFGLVVGDNGSAPMTNSDIRLGDIVVSYPGDAKGSWIQYDHGNRIHGRDFEPAARPGQDFLGGLLIAASKEQRSTVKDQLCAYTYRGEMEEQKGMRTASRLARCQMELPILRPKDGAGGQS